MREDANSGMREVRRPECHATILVPEVDHSIVNILCHCTARAEFCSVFRHDLTGRSVLIQKISWVTLMAVKEMANTAENSAHNACKKPVVRKKFQSSGFDM
jgi:hypothetical protein